MIPPTLYGPNDDFDPGTSHVLSALMRRFHEARENNAESVDVWGSGTPRREFLYVDDLASACLTLMGLDGALLRAELEKSHWVMNVGMGQDCTILDLARLIGDVVGYQGRISLDPSRPDGAPRKLLDSGRIRRLGWSPGVSLREGIEKTYSWYIKSSADVDNGLQ